MLSVVAARDFGVPKSSFLHMLSFVISFGLVKGALNFVAGRLSARIRRKTVLVLGWVSAISIPRRISPFFAKSRCWIVAANLFLGINQGFLVSLDLCIEPQASQVCSPGDFAPWHAERWPAVANVSGMARYSCSVPRPPYRPVPRAFPNGVPDSGHYGGRHGIDDCAAATPPGSTATNRAKRSASVGSTSRVSAVELNNPPRITMAIGPSIS